MWPQEGSRRRTPAGRWAKSLAVWPAGTTQAVHRNQRRAPAAGRQAQHPAGQGHGVHRKARRRGQAMGGWRRKGMVYPLPVWAGLSMLLKRRAFSLPAPPGKARRLPGGARLAGLNLLVLRALPGGEGRITRV
jgi:hypothetical protein